MCDEKLKRIPSRSTIENMTRELNVLSDIQVCEAVLRSDCCTLGWDATSLLDGKHLNGVYCLHHD